MNFFVGDDFQQVPQWNVPPPQMAPAPPVIVAQLPEQPVVTKQTDEEKLKKDGN